MNEQLDILADIFDIESSDLHPETLLSSLEWDSMAKLSLMVMMQTKFEKNISADQITSLKTIQDILNMMQ